MADHRDPVGYRPLIACAATVLVLAVALPARADAAETGRGNGCLNKRGICVDVIADPSGEEGASPRGGRRNTGPLRWRRTVVQGACGKLTYNGKLIAPPPDAPESAGGPVVFMALVDTRTGEIVRTAQPYCLRPRTPVAPSRREVAEVMRNSRGLSAGLGMSPRLDGLTGLETWLWAEVPPGPVAVAASVRGFSGQVSARPTRYHWDMGDGTTYTTTAGGSERQPAARHMYQTKGDYTVVLTVTWSGTFSFAGGGLGAPPAELGEVDIDYERDYHVAEARAVRQ
ncbi:MAG TPA: PKD domain-containing protein [Acidimicrobiales bacterium]|nr:PKD domain-containing protein [Acidimicrobiales bacterium]